MTLIFADRLNNWAAKFAQRFVDKSARVFTCRDLSREGWEIHLSQFEKSFIRLDNEIVSVQRIAGVITLCPMVTEHELVHIHEDDRSYVASEMNAFLTYFFSQLKCPMINKPVLGNFNGVNWRYEKWLRKARECGFSINPFSRSSSKKNSQSTLMPLETITLIEGRMIESCSEEVLAKGRQLARLAKINYLQIFYFVDNHIPYFHSANICPNIQDENIANQILNFFNNKA